MEMQENIKRPAENIKCSILGKTLDEHELTLRIQSKSQSIRLKKKLET